MTGKPYAGSRNEVSRAVKKCTRRDRIRYAEIRAELQKHSMQDKIIEIEEGG